jgi:hypothetical protein
VKLIIHLNLVPSLHTVVLNELSAGTTSPFLAYSLYFEKNKSRLMRSRCCLCVSVYVCLCIPVIVARQQVGKSPLVVARQRPGKNPLIVDR